MDKKAKMEGGFKLVVDGVVYGPFKEKYRDQYSDLAHRKGVSFEPVRLASGWLEPVPPRSVPVRIKALLCLTG